MSDVIQSKAPLIVAGESHPFVLSKKNLNNNVVVPLIGNRLPHAFKKLAVFVQDGVEIVEILTGSFSWHAHLDSCVTTILF